MVCENCDEEKTSCYVRNYVVKFEVWEAYNCCSEDCAIEKAKREHNLSDDDIIEVE